MEQLLLFSCFIQTPFKNYFIDFCSVSNDLCQDDSMLDSGVFDIWGDKGTYFEVLVYFFVIIVGC